MWSHRYKAKTIETIQYPDLIQFTPPTSPILSPVPRRLGSPLPIELVLKIIDHLKNGQQYATLVRLAQANSTYHRLAISKIYETITIDETNMLELDYGYNDCDLGLKITIVPTSGDNDDTQTPDHSAIEGPAESKKTPRHPAEEHCFRLIIDFPLANIAHSLDRVFGTLSSRFLNLQEIVYTTRALTDRDLIRHVGLPPSSLWASDRSPAVSNTADTSQSTEKTKRIILHLQSSPLCSVDAVLFYLTSWFQSRPTARKSTQFVVYGLNFAGPNYDFYCMDVECHFDQNGIPPGAFEHALAQWLFNLFSKGDTSTHSRLRLFDIPSLVFKVEDRPTNSVEANQAARDLIESLLDSKKRFEGHPKYLEAVMSKIDFYDSVYVDEEYPVVEPRPINGLGNSVMG